MKAHRWVASVVALALACLVACESSAPPVSSPAGTVTPLEVPEGWYYGVAWLPSGELVVNYGELRNDRPPVLGQLWRVAPDGSEFRTLEPPVPAGCGRPRFLRPTTLPDDRLGLALDCLATGPNSTMLAFDPSSGSLEELVTLDLGVDAFTMNPAMDRGLLSRGSSICQGLAWFSSEGAAPVDLELGPPEARFNLADEFRPSADCSGTGRADYPAWSPDGDTIAFVASAPGGVSGVPRLDLPWSLYLWDGVSDTASELLTGIVSPRGLAWSPDGNRLAFGGRIGGTEGTWVYDPAADELVRAAAEICDWLAWAPDGAELACIVTPPPPTDPSLTTLHRLELPDRTPMESAEPPS